MIHDTPGGAMDDVDVCSREGPLRRHLVVNFCHCSSIVRDDLVALADTLVATVSKSWTIMTEGTAGVSLLQKVTC